jgi:pyruvate dehydrogenase E1 component beta subunit
LTIRGIINRGGEQGAQHSQSLHSLFAHIPGLRVVMPYSVGDARDLLIASVLCDDPVMYIDDRWLYETEAELDEYKEIDLRKEGPKLISKGSDITFVSSSYGTKLATEARTKLLDYNIEAEIIDLRILNPFISDLIIESVMKTKRLIVVDGSWRNCGFASEVLASVYEEIPDESMKNPPCRITLPCSPAPCSRPLEEEYYITSKDLITKALSFFS